MMDEDLTLDTSAASRETGMMGDYQGMLGMEVQVKIEPGKSRGFNAN